MRRRSECCASEPSRAICVASSDLSFVNEVSVGLDNPCPDIPDDPLVISFGDEEEPVAKGDGFSCPSIIDTIEWTESLCF